jgi:hypothetical protein
VVKPLAALGDRDGAVVVAGPRRGPAAVAGRRVACGERLLDGLVVAGAGAVAAGQLGQLGAEVGGGVA